MNSAFIQKLAEHSATLIGIDQCHVSAVCVPLIPKGSNEFDILFEVRSSNIDSQPGDICFPGGMLEEGETPKEAACREMQEELLVLDSQIQMVGELDYVKTSSLVIYPFSVVLTDYRNTYSKDEVEETFQVPLEFFLKNEPEVYVTSGTIVPPEDFPYDRIYKGRDYGWRERKDTVLFYEYEGRHIWGLTAKIMKAFSDLCKNYV